MANTLLKNEEVKNEKGHKHANCVKPPDVSSN